MRPTLLIGIFLVFISCNEQKSEAKPTSSPYITVLGIAQDGGYPHIGCQKECCGLFYRGKSKKQRVVSLGVVDSESNKKFLFEATPDITTQLDDLERYHLKTDRIIDGVFLTHAHIGHYSGLMYFGREALGKKEIPVYAMPKMKQFLESNGPWQQLVKIKNIAITELKANNSIQLTSFVKVTPFIVPHRDEYSETIGYKIEGPNKSALFIPDINKWELWNRDIVEEVSKVDYAFLDATFFKNGEIDRPMSEVPHPFIEETVALFKNQPLEIRNKVIFIHFNHTNPALQPNALEKEKLNNMGFRCAQDQDQFEL